MTPAADTSIKATRLGPVDWDGLLEGVRRNRARVGSWALPFVLVVYLGLKGGGYDAIVRDEVGVAIWWIVIIGAAVGLLPTAQLQRNGWVGLGLRAAFHFWTGIGIA